MVMDPDADLFDVTEDGNDVTFNLVDVAEAKWTPVPSGTYDAIVDEIEYTRSSTNKPMLAWKFKIIGGEYDGRTIRNWTVLQDFGLNQLKQILTRIAPDIDLSCFRPKSCAADLIGRACRLKVNQRRATKGQYAGELMNNVREVLPPEGITESFLPE